MTDEKKTVDRGKCRVDLRGGLYRRCVDCGVMFMWCPRCVIAAGGKEPPEGAGCDRCRNTAIVPVATMYSTPCDEGEIWWEAHLVAIKDRLCMSCDGAGVRNHPWLDFEGDAPCGCCEGTGIWGAN